MRKLKLSESQMADHDFECDHCGNIIEKGEEFYFWEKHKRICAICAEIIAYEVR